jgi:putative ABC transport system permease protein
MRQWLRRFHRPSDGTFAAEIEAHLAHETDEQIERGLPPEDARYAALRRFGNVTRHLERFREASPWFRLETVWQDVRYGWRSLWRTPLVTSVVIISLSLGIGVNAAIVSAAQTLLWVPLQLPAPAEVFFLALKDERPNKDRALPGGVPYGYDDQVRQLLKPIGVGGPWTSLLSTIRSGSLISREWVLFASGGAVEALGISPRLGRWPTASEQAAGAPVAVLTDRFWREQCAGTADILGRPLRFGKSWVTVIGVAPPDFEGLEPARSYGAVVPLRQLRQLEADWVSPQTFFPVIARLARGVSMRAAADRVDRWTLERVPAAHAYFPFLPHTEVIRPRDFLVPKERQQLLARVVGGLHTIAGMVLLLGCTNLAAAMLARAAVRRREMAMRVTLGATPSRLFRTMTTEFTILAVLGTAGGVVASRGVLSAVRPGLEANLDPSRMARTALIFASDATVLGFSLLLSLLTCVIFGVTPVAKLLRIDPLVALRPGGERDTRTSRWQRVLVSAQVAATCVLLVTALLFLGNVRRALAVNLGYTAEHVLIAPVFLYWPQYDVPRSIALRAQIISRARQYPGIEAAAFGAEGPFIEDEWSRPSPSQITVDGVDRVVERSRPSTGWGGIDAGLVITTIDEGYRSTLELPLLAGRDFSKGDTASSEPVALVNEATVRLLWSKGSAVDARVRLRLDPKVWFPETGSLRVVGVVGNARFDVKRGTVPCIYLPRTQFQQEGGGVLYVRTRGATSPAVAWVQRVVHETVPDEPIPVVESVEQRMEVLIGPELVATRLLWWFAGLALALSVLGIYGLTAHHVARRARELAIRLALGASPGNVVRTVGWIAMAPVAAGVVLGCGAVLAGAALLQPFLVEVDPLDSRFYACAGGLLLTVAVLAAWWPIRSATRIDPAVTLRTE